MHPNTVFPNPIFIPKLIHIDTSFPERFVGAQSFLVPANFFAHGQYQRLCENAVKNCDVCIIDPVTNAFTYDGFLNKPTYRNLPYAPEHILTAIELRSNSSLLEQFVQSVIDFQRENGAAILIAPYLFARDIDDARFMVNLDLVTSSITYVQQSDIELPLFAMLNIGSSCIENPRVLDIVVEQYAGFDIQGFFLCVENFDDRFVSYEHLIGLAQLCRTLSSRHDLIMSTIASFGQILCSLDINGFVGGVGWLETFREFNLRSDREGFGAQQIPRARYYYIPELFSYVRPDDMVSIFDPEECPSMATYRCDCPVCQTNLPTEGLDKKEHFLHRRFREMEELSAQGSSERPEYMRRRLGLALALADAIEDEVLIRIPTEHLVRWLNVLDALTISVPSPEEGNGEDLSELIHKARQED